MSHHSAGGEDGFTLIELLTVTCILVVLTTLPIQCYNLYKRKAYDTYTDHMFNNIRVALEGGRIETPLSSPLQFFWFSANQPGPLPQPEASDILPGLKNQVDIRLAVLRNDQCEGGLSGDWCISEWIWLKHCKGNKNKSWWRTRNGIEQVTEWEGAGSC
jgi:prepilin-type N-terminal cleavage/methylation domain-containing protein